LANQRFREILEERGVSQSALAKTLRVSRHLVKSWPQNRTPIPELSEVMTAAIGLPPEKLLRGERTARASLLSVFPFEFPTTALSDAVRLGLSIALVGIVIGAVVEFFQLVFGLIRS
jgi:transcriptional regulator with XRE-family HTH domain